VYCSLSSFLIHHLIRFFPSSFVELVLNSNEDSSLRLVQVKMAISRLHTVLDTFKRAISPERLPQDLVLTGDQSTVEKREKKKKGR
jgi:hypothetical protein